MEILTSYTRPEFEQIIRDQVQKCLSGKLIPPQPEPSDRIGIDEACNLTGYRKPTIYKLSFNGAIPCTRFGKRLVFSRKELSAWMKERTIRKISPEAQALEQLAVDAKKKLA
jgi:excisionase family DNA binding protein